MKYMFQHHAHLSITSLFCPQAEQNFMVAKKLRFILLSLKLTKSRDPLKIIDPRILLITRLLTDLSFLITCLS